MSIDPVIVIHLILLGIMLLGVISLLLVIVPGLVITWAAIMVSIAVYGFNAGFNTITIVVIILETLVMLAGNLIDNIIIGANAKGSGASWVSLAVALAAGIAGTALLPPVGGLILAPIGLLIAELIRLREYKGALTSTKGMVTGCGLAIVTRMAIGFLMIAGWGIWFYFSYFHAV